MKYFINIAVCLTIALIWQETPLAWSISPSTKELRQWSRDAQKDFEQRRTLVTNPAVTELLGSIVSRLHEQVDSDLPPMVVKVVQDTRPDAAVYPNGVCYISTGMLAMLRNEDQLAMVLAHELIHYVRRHAMRVMSGWEPVDVPKNAFHVVDRQPAESGLDQRPLTRQAAEAEADREGFALILKAGYDASRIAALMDGQLETDVAGKSFCSRRAILSQSAGASNASAAAPNPYRYDRHYLEKISPALLASARDAIQKGQWHHAGNMITHYVTVRSADPEGFFLRGEIHRHTRDRMHDAILAYEAAIGLDQEFAPAYRELGVVHLKLGQLQKAGRYFKTYLSLSPLSESNDYIREYLKLCSN